MLRRLFLFAVALSAASPAFAQSPDARGEVVLDQPFYRGVWADAPIPPELHLRNEGGSDGLGLCVPTSILIAGMYQRIPAFAAGKQSGFWKTVKSRPGGYYPSKLEKLLNEFRPRLPGVRWLSWEGVGTELIERYTRQGIPVAATTNTGALYGYQPIHHYVTVIHLDSERAMVVDSNDPGKYHAMPRAEFDRRFVDGDQGWLFVWLYQPPVLFGLAGYTPAALLFGASGLVLIGAARIR